MGINEVWEELKFELGGTRLNKLEAVKDKKLILGAGNKNAKILFIGEAPGKKEDESGMPFVGAAGKMLSSLLLLKVCFLIATNKVCTRFLSTVKIRHSGSFDLVM